MRRAKLDGGAPYILLTAGLAARKHFDLQAVAGAFRGVEWCMLRMAKGDVTTIPSRSPRTAPFT
jgi:hypothetical protein